MAAPSLSLVTWAEQYPEERLVAPDPSSPARYAQFAAHLQQALGHGWVMEHSGSTAVPGLCAKPVIDIVLRLPEGQNRPDVDAELLAAGWSVAVVVGDHWATFYPTAGRRAAIGHIFTAAQWPEAHMRLFVRWLRTRPADRRRYADLKRKLVAAGVWSADYTHRKAEFVLEIVNKAREEQGLIPIDGRL